MEPYLKLRAYKDSDGYQQIQLCYYSHGKMLLLNSTVKTKKEYWDTDKQKIVSRAKEIGQDVGLLNQILSEKLQKLSGIVVNFKRKYDLPPKVDYVKEEFLKEGKKIIEAKEVKQEFENWIEWKKPRVKYIKIFKTVLLDLKEFHPQPIYYNTLTLDFFEKLRAFWFDKDPPIQNSTIKKRWKCFKMFLHDKYAKGENEFNHFAHFDIDLDDNDNQPIYIPTPEEFDILIDYPILSGKLDDARDLYIIGCTTGLRYSDVVRLTPQNIIGDYLISDIKKAKKAQHKIPLGPIAREFLEKQIKKYGKVKEISNQKLNAALIGLRNPKKPDELPQGGLFRFLSEVHPAKPFSDQVTLIELYGKESPDIKVPKWMVLTFHSSRKFFISYLLNVKNANLGNVMKWSGHKKLGTVLRYIEQGYNEQELMKEAFTRKRN